MDDKVKRLIRERMSLPSHYFSVCPSELGWAVKVAETGDTIAVHPDCGGPPTLWAVEPGCLVNCDDGSFMVVELKT